jgi:predicted porin
MNKAFACAALLAGFGASAQAADLDLKDPLPSSLTWQGITLYGTIDAGYGYQTHGAPTSGEFRQDAVYNIYSSKFANKPISALESQAIEQSFIGIKVEEAIGAGWVAIARLETSFDPYTGTLNDGPKSLLLNAGLPLNQQSANGDSSRAGQAFNGPAYAGVSSDAYGTLTVGRHISLQGDVFREYDPQDLSNAFSLLRWSSSLAGAGITEASNVDESVKYAFRYGPVHAAGIYSAGGPDTGFFGPAYGANVGGAYGGFSIDAVYQQVNAGVQASALTASPAVGTQSIYAPPANYSNTLVNAQITDSDSWSVQGKYTFDFGGGYKDEVIPGSRLTFFAGYEDIRYYNSSAARDAEYVGDTIAGGYVIGHLAAITGVSKASTYYFYASTRELQVAWTGARYELPSGWTFSAGYYHIDQPAFSSASSLSNPQAGSPNQQRAYTAGSLDSGSFVVDYRFNKHFDVYVGVNYSTIDGGLASGYLANDDTTFVTGARLKF